METKQLCLLKKEDMTNPDKVPAWVTEEYKTFHETVTDRTFPCYFGMAAEKKGELRYAYITQEDWTNLPEAIMEFNKLFDAPKLIRHGLFVFVEPEKVEKDIPYYRGH